MILIQDNFLSPETCDLLIELGDKNKHLFKPHHTMFDLPLVLIDKKITAKIGLLFCNYLGKKGIDAFWNRMQITKWPAGSEMDWHQDTAVPGTTCTSITYLNEEYGGGETVFDSGINITPKKGKAVFFDGISYSHGVMPITFGTRYCLATWFSEDLSKLDL